MADAIKARRVRGLGLYEDELNYDIACRVKRILETQTPGPALHDHARPESRVYAFRGAQVCA